MSGFFTNLLSKELEAESTKTAGKADDTSSPGDDTTIHEDMGGKKAPPFMGNGKKDKDNGDNSEGYDKEAALEKVAKDTLETKNYIDKVASILHDDHGEDDERLFRNCASAVVHLKLAGRIKPEFDQPKLLAEMAYHMYEDILSNA